MRIIVPIKQILDPGGITVRRDKERMFVNREDYIIGPGSKAAIEAALQLKGDGEVIALSLGEPRVDDALREALAMGCDQAVLLCDEAFQQADVAVTATVLAAAIEKLGGADLVITGRESGDTGAGQIGPRLAEARGYAQVTDVWAAVAGEASLTVTRRWAGAHVAVEVAYPAVVTVAPEAFPPRLPHGARIMSAYRDWEVEIWNALDLGLGADDLNPLIQFRSEGYPPPLETGEVYDGAPESIAQDVLLALRLQKLL